jgi:hypothetical protein
MDEAEKAQSEEVLRKADQVLEDFEGEIARVRREIKFYIDRGEGAR